jgi:hypothetical protein
MQTALTLTQGNLDRMVQFAKGRISSIDSARGNGWIKDREKYEMEYDGNMERRRFESGVFFDSNETLRLIAGGIDHITAKETEALFKVDPWFDAIPRTKANNLPSDAEAITRHLKWKLGSEQMDFQSTAEEMIRVSNIIGECVSKIAYVANKDDYERIASILIDSEGNPVTDQDGNFIFEENGIETIQTNDETGNPVSYDSPTEHPEIDLSPGSGYRWEEQIVQDTNIHYIGAKAIPLHFKEFYCPLTAKSIQESDFVAHVTSMKLSVFCQQYGIHKDETGAFVMDDGSPMDEHIQKVLDVVRGNSSQSKAAGDMPKQEMGETEEPCLPDGDPEFKYAEIYMQFDARDDKKPTKVFLALALDTDLPIYWDYLSNVTPEGKYPFEAVVNDKEPNRWYGRSWFKKYEAQSKLIDKLFNQVIYRNDFSANPIKFRNKAAVVQWQDNQPFEVGPDKVFDLNDGYTKEAAFGIVELPELDQMTKYLLETSIANWRTASGISTATQGSMGDMPAETTATGTEMIIASGNTIFEPMILAVKRGLERILRMVVRCQYYYQENEEYTFQQNDQQAIAFLNKETVRHLDLYVELTLTNLSATQKLQQAQTAANLGNQFLAIPPQYKAALKPIYEQIFQSLQIDNADEIFQSILNADAAMAQSSQTKSLSAKITESIAFKDLGNFLEAQLNLLEDLQLLTSDDVSAIKARLNANGQQTTTQGGAPDGSAGTAPLAETNSAGSEGDAGQGTGGTDDISHGEMLQPQPQPAGEQQPQGSPGIG